MVAWTGSADRPHSGVLTVVVWERWAHTSLSPLHRTTAVGAVKAAAEGDEAGTLHSPTQASRWRERVSVPTSSPRRTLTCPDIQPQTAARANPSARRERRRGELLALWLRDFFFFFLIIIIFLIFFFLPTPLTLEVRAVYCERGWDRYSFPSPCVWASLSRSMWKVSGKSDWLSLLLYFLNLFIYFTRLAL